MSSGGGGNVSSSYFAVEVIDIRLAITVTLCNAVTSITAMCVCVCVSLPCCHLFIPIESSIELYTHNTPVFLNCIHMTHLYFLVKSLVVYFFGFGYIAYFSDCIYLSSDPHHVYFAI